MSERRRTGTAPESAGTTARTALVAAVVTGLSAVVVSLITGLGSSLQGFVTDALSGDDKPAASAPAAARTSTPLKVAVVPEEGGSFLVADRKVTGSEDRALLTGERTPESWKRLLRRIGAVSVGRTAYKLTVTNASSEPLRVVDVVPVVTRRTGAFDTTLIEPLGGLESDTVQAELALDNRYPKFTQHGKPYFSRKSQTLKAGDGFVMAVESRLRGKEYVEYYLRVDYIDSKGVKRSLKVNDPDSVPPVFRLSGLVANKTYAEYWGPDETGGAWRPYSPAERK
ncbi:hypothetical protein [Streptomyces sp. NPDC007088]|uniref:hypothetical protein n=1 Tax=Streptomyces sp. NPDC007088 TaxID=3364773 RepID=UPI0036767EAD